ncbi:hypothetical protein [Candidatus Nitrospira salsa]
MKMRRRAGWKSWAAWSGLRASFSLGCATSRMIVILLLLGGFLWVGCQSTAPPRPPDAHLDPSLSCEAIATHISFPDRITTLRDMYQAFSAGCDDTVITYGTQAQDTYKYKTFRVLKEASNIFLPDGTLIDYVLESYERGFLSVLLAISYYRQHNFEASQVELRRLDHEIFTPLYNYGADPINLLFSAVLWEMLGEPSEAWVDWNRLQGQEGQDEAVRTFASHRLDQLKGREGSSADWRVYAIGRFPGIDWDIDFQDSSTGYFSVKPQHRFLPACFSESGVRISTHSWFQKIALRHAQGYHPLLHAQSWLRLPFGVAYSLITFSAGAGIMVGGCFVDMASEGHGALCQLSILGGVAVMQESPHVLRYALRPDLRHWDNVPSSFLFTRAPDLQDEPCWRPVSTQSQGRTIKIFGRHDRNHEMKVDAR